MPNGRLQIIRGPRPPRHDGHPRRRVQCSAHRPNPLLFSKLFRKAHAADRNRARFARLQGALASLGPDDTEERKVLEAALKKAKTQAAVPPVEDQIAMSVKFLERAKKGLAVADTELQAAVKKKSQCEQEIAEAEADLARMRQEHSASGEEPKTEVKQLRARVAQVEEILTSEVPEKLRRTFARMLRQVEWVVVQKMFCRPQSRIWLVGWTTGRQNSGMRWIWQTWSPPAPSQASSPRGSPRWRVSFHHRPHFRAWCREESDRVGIQEHQSGRGVPPRAPPSRKFVGGQVSGS